MTAPTPGMLRSQRPWIVTGGCAQSVSMGSVAEVKAPRCRWGRGARRPRGTPAGSQCRRRSARDPGRRRGPRARWSGGCGSQLCPSAHLRPSPAAPIGAVGVPGHDAHARQVGRGVDSADSSRPAGVAPAPARLGPTAAGRARGSGRGHATSSSVSVTTRISLDFTLIAQTSRRRFPSPGSAPRST